MSGPTKRSDQIVLDNVSKFYGEVLGVNRIDLTIPPGITGPVGPNGSGKTTLMNLLVGLLRPSAGSVYVRGLSPDRPETMFREIGFATQVDACPTGLTGQEFVEMLLRVYGLSAANARERAAKAIDRVGLTEAAGRKVAGYSNAPDWQGRQLTDPASVAASSTPETIVQSVKSPALGHHAGDLAIVD